MDKEFSADLITLIDDEGKEHNFEIMDVITQDETEYYALLPVYENQDDILNDNGEYFILEAIEEDGEQQFAEVIDAQLRRKLSQIFEDRFNNMFYED